MNPYLLLAMLGTAEAIVFLDRYRSAVGRRVWSSTRSCFLTTTLRILFIYAGATAVMKGVPFLGLVAAYVLPACIANHLTHLFLDRKKES